MTTKQERLKEVYNHLRNYFGVHTQIDFAEAIHITRPALSSAMNGNEAYLTKNLFQKICAAYPGVFNLDYLLTGEGDLLTLEEEVHSNGFEKQMTQQNNLPPATDQTYIMSRVVESMLKPIQDAHDKLVATLEKQIADKDAQIQQQADLIASLQKVISDLRALPSVATIEEIMNRHPFPIGVAETQESPRAQV